MKWIKCELLKEVSKGKDELNNSIKSTKRTRYCFARFAPWSSIELSLEGRKITAASKKLLVRLPVAEIKPATKIVVDDITYNIKKKTDLGRFTLLYVEAVKVE